MTGREVVRHAIPHKYDTISRGKLQEKIARLFDKIFTMCVSAVNESEIDKSLTMCVDWVNDVKMLAEANFAHVMENGRAFNALPFQALSCKSL